MTLIWRIFYADGSAVSSDDCAPADVPGYGVIAIAQPDKREGPYIQLESWVLTSNYDWYYWRIDQEQWFGCVGDASMWELILHREPITGICQGRYIPHAKYNAIIEEGRAWADSKGLPPKRSVVPGEKRQ